MFQKGMQNSKTVLKGIVILWDKQGYCVLQLQATSTANIRSFCKYILLKNYLYERIFKSYFFNERCQLFVGRIFRA